MGAESSKSKHEIEQMDQNELKEFAATCHAHKSVLAAIEKEEIDGKLAYKLNPEDLKEIASGLTLKRLESMCEKLPGKESNLVPPGGTENLRAQVSTNQEAGGGFLNTPGKWTYFLSHMQAEGAAFMLDVFASCKDDGRFTCWLDVKMQERDLAAMEEGVKNSEKFLAFVSPGYFTRPYCIQELEWAVKYKKPIVATIDVKYKNQIGEILKTCPPHLRKFGNINIIDLNRGDAEYWEVGMNKIHKAKAKVLECEGVNLKDYTHLSSDDDSSSESFSEMPPNLYPVIMGTEGQQKGESTGAHETSAMHVFTLSKSLPSGGLRVRQFPTLDSAQVGSLESFSKQYLFDKVSGDWAHLAPEHYEDMTKSFQFSPYDCTEDGWCAIRLRGKTLLDRVAKPQEEASHVNAKATSSSPEPATNPAVTPHDVDIRTEETNLEKMALLNSETAHREHPMMPLPNGFKYHAFLSHAWKNDELKRDNHKRVESVFRALEAKGIACWFDNKDMQDLMDKQMCDGLKFSATIIVFITKLYNEKVNSDNLHDNCLKEFGMASRKYPDKMIPVPMEPCCLNTTTWEGPVAMYLGGQIYKANFAEDDAFDENINNLVAEILRKCGQCSPCAKKNLTTATSDLTCANSTTTANIPDATAVEKQTNSGLGTRYVVLSENGSNVRRNADLSADIIRKLKPGEEVNAIFIQDDWLRIGEDEWTLSKRGPKVFMEPVEAAKKRKDVTDLKKKYKRFFFQKSEAPLLSAAKKGNVEDMKILLAAGEDVFPRSKRKKWTILHYVADMGDDVELTEMILGAPHGNELLNACDTSGETPLMLAANKNHQKLVTFLLEKGAKPVNSKKDESKASPPPPPHTTPQPSYLHTPPESIISFPKRSWIQIQGLKKSTEYNGKYGEVMEYESSSGRWNVKLESGKLINLLQVNISRVKNCERIPVRKGEGDNFYCGRKMNQCRCGGCDGACGPTNGCPCDSCYKFSLHKRSCSSKTVSAALRRMIPYSEKESSGMIVLHQFQSWVAAKEISTKEKKVIVIDWYSENGWCPPCRRLAPSIDRLVRKFAGQDVNFYKITIPQGWRGGIAGKVCENIGAEGIHSVPQLLLFNGHISGKQAQLHTFGPSELDKLDTKIQMYIRKNKNGQFDSDSDSDDKVDNVLRCNKRHALMKYTFMNNYHTCDLCRGRIQFNQTGGRCSVGCDYDVCPECIAKLTTKRQPSYGSGAGGGGVTSEMEAMLTAMMRGRPQRRNSWRGGLGFFGGL